MKFAAVFLVAMSASAGVAAGAQRYAAPEGKGAEPCTQEAPCSLKNAVNNAGATEEVIVTGGTYALKVDETISEGAAGVSIHGDFSGPMPTVTGSSSFPLLSIGGSDVHVSYLAISNTHTPLSRALACDVGGEVDRTSLAASGEEAIAVLQIGGCRIRDSVIRAAGNKALAISSSGRNITGAIRNVTAIATGSGSIGAGSYYGDTITPGAYTLDLKNTIVSGESADLVAHSGEGFDGPGNIVVSNSSFDHPEQKGTGTVAEGSGNLRAAPLFVDAANGDYREAAGSPTIDAGVNDQLGPLDLAGNARVQGPAPDIGAFEFASSASSGLPGGVRSLRVKPKRFRARKSGGPVANGILRSKPPVGTTVTYTVSGGVKVDFSVSRAHKGRLVGRHCVKGTRSNANRKKCAYYTPVKGAFTQNAATGSNHFVFSGRIGGKTLKPGRYKLTALAGHLISEAFTIVG
jgi:hypothetical protein